MFKISANDFSLIYSRLHLAGYQPQEERLGDATGAGSVGATPPWRPSGWTLLAVASWMLSGAAVFILVCRLSLAIIF